MWTNVDINANQVKYDTGYSSLIKLPNSDNKIWVSNKCIREGMHRTVLNVGFNDDWSYNAVRGKTIKFEISGESVIEAFKNQVVQKPEMFKENKPKRIEAGKIDVDTELIR